eukprot:4026253-Alexandrium_andersonii.AAC.1
MEGGTWWGAVAHPENRRRNCRVPAGPPPYNGLRLRPDMTDDARPGGVFTVWGDRPKPIVAKSVPKLFQTVSHHAMRE